MTTTGTQHTSHHDERIAHCTVCGRSFSHKPDITIIECGNCHTRYDLVNKIVDRTSTRIAPSQCKHGGSLFIASARNVGADLPNYNVYVCPDCGEFSVIVNRRGVWSKVQFALSTDELVQAAGKWNQLLSEDD